MKKNFDINLVDPLSFTGVNDKNIKLIEDNFSTGIVIRGSKIKLDGDKQEIDIISKISWERQIFGAECTQQAVKNYLKKDYL